MSVNNSQLAETWSMQAQHRDDVCVEHAVEALYIRGRCGEVVDKGESRIANTPQVQQIIDR